MKLSFICDCLESYYLEKNSYFTFDVLIQSVVILLIFPVFKNNSAKFQFGLLYSVVWFRLGNGTILQLEVENRTIEISDIRYYGD